MGQLILRLRIIFLKDKGDYYQITDGLPQNTVYPGHPDNKVV